VLLEHAAAVRDVAAARRDVVLYPKSGYHPRHPVLDYLVTSRVRRLLDLLWRRDARGSIAHLARLAGVGFASAHRELLAMERHGLVVAAADAGAKGYRANRAHPLARALGQLLAPPPKAAGAEREARRLRGQLAALGAPLHHDAAPRADAPPEEVVVRGVQLAHRDADVARTLPVCLYRQRETLDGEHLRAYARRLGEKRALGFFLDLTAELSGDRRFAAWARPLRDRRCTAPRAFFDAASRSSRERRLAETRTPRVARRWGWRMNMDVDACRSVFDRFVTQAAA
jgi:hypothetical protein